MKSCSTVDRSFHPVLLTFVSTILLSGLSGCSGPAADYSELGLVDVTGNVTLDGSPVSDAVVTFEDTESGQFSYGLTDSKGSYEMHLDSEMMGVVPGRKLVRISTTRKILGLNSDEEAPEGEGGEESEDHEELTEQIPDKYNQKSELTVTVSDSEDTFDFELTSE